MTDIQPPLELTYVKIIKFFLITVGAWPKEGKSGVLTGYLLYLLIQTTLITIGEYLYIFMNFKLLSLYDLGDKILNFILTLLELYRVSLPLMKRYGYILHDFTTKFHLAHYAHLGEVNKEICIKIDKLSNFFIVVMSILVVSAMTLFCLAPIYTNYKDGVTLFSDRPDNYTLKMSVTYYCPFFNPQNHYKLATIIHFWFCYICTTAICANDMLMSVLVFQIIGHIHTLKHDLYEIKKPKGQLLEVQNPITKEITNVLVEKYNEQENEEVHKRIVKCVEHHKLIASFTDEFSSFFGPVLGFNYLFHLFSCCLVLLECSQGEPDALARYGPLTVVIFFQLMQISITFEIVGSESEKLKDYVYDVPWECMDVRNRRSIYIFLQRSQTPIHITAMGMTSVGVQTMAAILKTTFSYFAFLQSMSK